MSVKEELLDFKKWLSMQNRRTQVLVGFLIFAGMVTLTQCVFGG